MKLRSRCVKPMFPAANVDYYLLLLQLQLLGRYILHLLG